MRDHPASDDPTGPDRTGPTGSDPAADEPVHLTRDSERTAGAEAASDPADARLAQALRAALEDQPRGDGGPPAVLAGVVGRARRLHRRRLATAAGGALVAAAAVVVVVGVIPARGGAAPVVPAAPSASAQPSATAVPAPAPTATGGDQIDGSGPSVGTPSADLTSGSLLRAEDVTAFTGPLDVAEGDVWSGGGTDVVAGICVDGVLDVDPAASVARRDYTLRVVPGTSGPPFALVEHIWRWDDPGQASTAVDQLAAQVPGCAGPGLEGRSATTSLDAAGVTPSDGRALATTSTDGTGARQLQVVMQQGATLVQLDVTWSTVVTDGEVGTGATPADAGDAALQAATATARAAIARATSS